MTSTLQRNFILMTALVPAMDIPIGESLVPATFQVLRHSSNSSLVPERNSSSREEFLLTITLQNGYEALGEFPINLLHYRMARRLRRYSYRMALKLLGYSPETQWKLSSANLMFHFISWIFYNSKCSSGNWTTIFGSVCNRTMWIKCPDNKIMSGLYYIDRAVNIMGPIIDPGGTPNPYQDMKLS